MFNLKDYRLNVLNMSIEEFAKLIDASPEDIVKKEETPEAYDINFLLKIVKATGSGFDELINYKKPKPAALQVADTWGNSRLIKQKILAYIEEMKQDFNVKEKHGQMIKELEGMVHSLLVKPTIAVVGLSDAGKSVLINTLLGVDKMPSSWTPTTSISIHLRHIEDRPEFMDEEAWIFKAGKRGFDVKRFDDKTYCEKWKIAGGDSSILANYGTRQGEQYKMDEAVAAVVYLESPILKICDIVDLPGFGTGDRQTDDVLARKSKQFADVVIYLSIANGFLRGTDIEFLKSTINSLPVIENKENNLAPLSNLFIIASQAHTVNNGNRKDLETILNAAAERMYSEIPEEILTNREEQSGYNHEMIDIRNRFFTYTTDKPYLRESFEDELKQLLEYLPAVINESAKKTFKKYLEDQEAQIETEIHQLNDIQTERTSYIRQLNEIKNDEPLRLNHDQKKRMEVIKEIKKLRNNTMIEFESEFLSLISVDRIAQLIKDKQYKKKKDDMERLAGFLSSKLQGRLQNILKKESEKLNTIIDDYLDDFNTAITKFDHLQLKEFNIPFDATKAFASGLAGLATFGGLAIWASTLGNLGAYILVAKGVSVLSAVGISIAGGTAGAAAGVAALGGPVVLGVALAVIVGISVFTFASGGWQKSIAKKIVKEYSNNNAYEQFKAEIDGYWNDTETAFEQAAEHLNKEWQIYVDELNHKVSSYKTVDFEESIIKANKMKDFIYNLPI